MVNIWKCAIFSAVIAATALAQVPPQERRAALAGGNPNGPGKCTIEIVADVTAEVEIRGDVAILRTLAGAPAQWRRFQCNVPVPANPIGFRFEGIDGRGRQQMRQAAGAGRSAVIRIDDPRPGNEGYTFDIMWNGAAGGPPPPPSGPPPNFGRGDRDGRDRDFGRPGPYRTDEAIRACQDAVIDQATARLRPRDARDIMMRNARVDDGPGRNDWIVGTFDIRRGRDFDSYRFSCSVDFAARRIRSADFNPIRDRR
jgi:hypothetical protein